MGAINTSIGVLLDPGEEQRMGEGPRGRTHRLQAGASDGRNITSRETK